MEDHLYPKRKLIEELDLIDAPMAKENKEIYSGQEASTHILEVSTHVNIKLESGYKVLTHRVKVSTPEDSEKSFKFRNISFNTFGQ